MDDKTIEVIKVIAAKAAVDAVLNERRNSSGMTAEPIRCAKSEVRESTYLEQFERQSNAISNLEGMIKVLTDKLTPALRQENKDDVLICKAAFVLQDGDSDIIKLTASLTDRIESISVYLNSLQRRIQLK